MSEKKIHNNSFRTSALRRKFTNILTYAIELYLFCSKKMNDFNCFLQIFFTNPLQSKPQIET